MLATNPINISVESKKRILQGEPMFDNTQELVIISKQAYLEMEKAKNNAEYLAKLDKSFAQFKRGETITFSMEELEEMMAEDWKPTQKVLNFIERTRNE